MLKTLTLGAVALAALAATSAAGANAASARTQLTCQMKNGKRTHVVVSPYFKTIAFAQRTIDGEPIIVFNPAFTSRFATGKGTVIFTFFHECGHHVLGHTKPRRRHAGYNREQKRRELAADCYAIREMWNRRMLTRQRMTTILRDLSRLQEDPEHPSGKVRTRVVVRCLRSYAKRGQARYDDNTLQRNDPYRQ